MVGFYMSWYSLFTGLTGRFTGTHFSNNEALRLAEKRILSPDWIQHWTLLDMCQPFRLFCPCLHSFLPPYLIYCLGVYIDIETQYKIYPYIYNKKHVVDKMIYLCQTRASLYLNIPCPWPLSGLSQPVAAENHLSKILTTMHCSEMWAVSGLRGSGSSLWNVATHSTPKRPGSVHLCLHENGDHRWLVAIFFVNSDKRIIINNHWE